MNNELSEKDSTNISSDMLMLLCKKKNRTYPDEEIRTFAAKRRRLSIIANELEHYWDNVINECYSNIGNGQYILDIDKLSIKIDKASIAIDSFVHNAFSLYDCMLHIINIALLDGKNRERQVTSEKITSDMKKSFPKVYEKLDILQESMEFKYLHDFDIVSKHRGLINSNYSLAMGTEMPSMEGSKIHEFEYDENEYESIWLHTLKDYVEKYYRLLMEIFKSIYYEMEES